MSYDSEFICTRCNKRIKKGREKWIGKQPYGISCAKIIRIRCGVLPEQVIPQKSKMLRFDRQTSGAVDLFGDYK